MTLYTPNYSIPYPTSGDPVHLGAAQMEALAKSIDTQMKRVADASALDATSTPTANRIVQRDANGRAQFANPSVNADAATKYYVDQTRLGGLTFQRRTTPPPAGTPSTTITFVV